MCVHGHSWYFRGGLYLIPINSKVQYNRFIYILGYPKLSLVLLCSLLLYMPVEYSYLKIDLGFRQPSVFQHHFIFVHVSCT